jgi:hypothetical protein
MLNFFLFLTLINTSKLSKNIKKYQFNFLKVKHIFKKLSKIKKVTTLEKKSRKS